MTAGTLHNQNSSKRSIVHGLLAYGSAELVNRVVRILVVVVIARQLVPELVGVAALTLSLFELTRVIANIGVGQKIISAADDKLDAVCNSAHGIFWFWCSIVAAIQFCVAAVLFTVFGQTLAAQMLVVLCGVYFFMPGGLVQCFRLMRAKKLATVAKIGAAQTIADHLITAVLILAWANPWAIILPKLMTAPLWLIMMRRAEPWSVTAENGYANRADMLSFGTAILATDILLALRNNLDKLIISAMLGVTALGSYYFAFNAGIGIIGTLAAAFGTVIYPYLCNQDSTEEANSSLKFIIGAGLLIFTALSAAQFFLAPIYVPMIFGEQWLQAIPLIQILSLAGVPLLLGAIASAYLRARGKATLDALLGLITCVVALSAMFLGAQTGLAQAAAGWVIGTFVVIISYSLILTTHSFEAEEEFSI
ncbi:oligosaccharide flippase family protein [Parasphingorhabdus sp.]|uniref:oligosaccharide flippase family protein n=1 Tax=Parasphingorhabdus sp. TaxID=2709688 RepID=UPI003A9492F0